MFIHSSAELQAIACVSRATPLVIRIIRDSLEQCLRWHSIHCSNCGILFKFDVMKHDLIPPWCRTCCENDDSNPDLIFFLLKRVDLTVHYLDNGLRIWIIDHDRF